ncbi:MAG TPA: MerR family transcriptional regulator [Actinomycetota bacterium]
MTGCAGELRIGEAAARVGVSSRTLRYYEELGLLTPSGRTPGGARRYTDDDIARLEHIRELQELMGFNLDEILAVMRIEDRLAKLRAEWQAGRPPERRAEMIEEALRHNADLRARVEAKITRLGAFLDSLDEKRERYRMAQREMDALVPSSK